MTTQTISVDTIGPEETERIAATMGARLRGGEAIELVSDLGGGKTAFTRGLARGANSNDVVSSPTFTISKVYRAEKFDIHHFDFYRLPDAGLASYELEDLLGDPGTVIVIEWAGIVEGVLPENLVRIALDKTGDTERRITITASDEYTYLLEDLC